MAKKWVGTGRNSGHVSCVVLILTAFTWRHLCYLPEPLPFLAKVRLSKKVELFHSLKTLDLNKKRVQEVVRQGQNQSNSVCIKRSCRALLTPWEVPWLLPAAHCWATSCVVESTAPWVAERWLVEMFKIQRKQRSSLIFIDIDLQAKLPTKAYILYFHL